MPRAGDEPPPWSCARSTQGRFVLGRGSTLANPSQTTRTRSRKSLPHCSATASHLRRSVSIPRSHALTVDSLERLRRALTQRALRPHARRPKGAAAGQITRGDRVPADGGADTRPDRARRNRRRSRRRYLRGRSGHWRPAGFWSSALIPRISAMSALARDWNFLHMQPAEAALEQGDVLHFELVSRYRGYEARIMRCVAIGAGEPGVGKDSKGAGRLAGPAARGHETGRDCA